MPVGPSRKLLPSYLWPWRDGVVDNRDVNTRLARPTSPVAEEAKHRKMSHKLTFSTGYGGSRFATYWGLVKTHRRPDGIAEEQYRVFQEALATMTAYVDLPLNQSRALEIGCGQRFTLTLLLDAFGVRATGIDVDYVAPKLTPRAFSRIWRSNGLERAIKTAARRALFDRQYYAALARTSDKTLSRESLDLRVMDACALAFRDDEFDFICSRAVFEHVHDVDRASSEMARVLKRSGAAWLVICPFPGLSGGHHADWSDPDEDRERAVPAWDHLREQQYVHDAFLNKLRVGDYLDIFARHLTVVRATPRFQGERYLTPEIRKELDNFSREDLLTTTFTVVLRKD